ncbi:translation initiation factor IF-2-like isoform X2 [Dermacentor silvarum]|uniref:translation initiation factor IF-2-like isoform X2 n=1 Tax=Dermacentor silvarum TaxID=543639 RepID=UPI002101714F|nr:translation initiation factor IF-2-like isoform X2 [Dermacentor silvarum]
MDENERKARHAAAQRQRRRQATPEARAREAAAKRQKRQANPELRAREAEAQRQRRQQTTPEARARKANRRADPEVRAREAAAKRRRRQQAATPEARAREAAARRRRRQQAATPETRAREAAAKRHRRCLPEMGGADARSKRDFLDRSLGDSCKVCDRLWFDNALTKIDSIRNEQSRANAITVMQQEFSGGDHKPVATACLPAIYDASALGPPASPSELCLGETLPAADGVKAQTVRVHRTGRSWPLVMCPHHSTSEAEALGVATADFSAVFPDIDFKQAAEVACDKPPFIEDSLVSTTCRVEPWRGLQDKCVGEYEAVLQHAERFCQTEHHITLVQCRKPQVSTCSVEVQADPWCQHHCGIGPIGVDLCET